MISGASEEELDIAIDRADLLLKIQNKDIEINRLNNIIKEQKETIDELQRDIEILIDDDDNDSVWLEEFNM